MHRTVFKLNRRTDLPIRKDIETHPHQGLMSKILTPGSLLTTNEATDEAMWTDENVRNRSAIPKVKSQALT